MLELLTNRRSIRKYKDQKVGQETIDKIVKGALTSPSGRNAMPWQIIVVTDKEILTSLGETRGRITAPIKNSPLGIIIVADPDLTDLWIEDASIMATIIQLTSESLGLGSCWLQVRGRLNGNKEDVEKQVKDILDIPENYRVECMIAIGYPDEELKPHDEKNLAYDKVHYNKF